MSKIKKSNDEIIVIYRNGNKTIAMNKDTGEKAEAKCSPEDEFNFGVGAKLALDRLFGAPYYDATKYRLVEQDHYQVGDKVLIKRKKDQWMSLNPYGKMDKHLGKPMTIRKKYAHGVYGMFEDFGEGCSGNGWIWNDSCIVGKLVEIESENGYAGQAEEAAKMIKAYIDALTKHGLTREEAFELFAIATRK